MKKKMPELEKTYFKRNRSFKCFVKFVLMYFGMALTFDF